MDSDPSASMQPFMIEAAPYLFFRKRNALHLSEKKNLE